MFVLSQLAFSAAVTNIWFGKSKEFAAEVLMMTSALCSTLHFYSMIKPSLSFFVNFLGEFLFLLMGHNSGDTV